MGGREVGATSARGPRPAVTFRGAGAAENQVPTSSLRQRYRLLALRRWVCMALGKLLLDTEPPGLNARAHATHRALPPKATWS